MGGISILIGAATCASTVMIDPQRLQELAALQATGALDGEDAQEFQRLLSSGEVALKQESSAFADVAVAVAESLPLQQAPHGLKAKLLKQVEPADQPSAAGPGYRLIRQHDQTGWRNLKVRGASVKLLSLDSNRGYAVVMGRLEAGCHYPAHTHSGPEELYVLSGDLHIEGRVLRAGDFHHADAGTSHGENFSEEGCVILAVVSAQDLLAQM